ncbi:hypothetical protein BH23ACT10_BH23ACT10_17890 [soil metagenome]
MPEADVAAVDAGAVDVPALSLGSLPERRIWLLAAAAAVAAVALVGFCPAPTVALFTAPWWMPAAVFAGFVISEPLVFRVESRNEAVSFAPSDIPLALGLLTLSPVLLLAVRVVSTAIALVIWRRQPPFKLALNLSAFMIEGAVAITVLRLLVGGGAVRVDMILWLALIAALLAGLVVGGITIASAISYFDGSPARRVRREVTHSYLFYLPGAVLGASTMTPYLVEPWLGVVFIAPAPLVWLVLRSHGALMNRFTDLSQIHAFSSQVGRSAQLDEIVDTAVQQIARHLRASTVALIVYDGDARVGEACLGDRALLGALPGGPDAPTWPPSARSGELLRIEAERDDPLCAALRASGVGEGIVVALADDVDVLGILLVADRCGAATRFDRNDLDRLRPLSQQLTVALRKGLLHVEIQHKALHDRLTGLPNRAYLDVWLSGHLGAVTGRSVAVLMIDLDRFKEVNDTLGHHAGDQLLIEVTARLRRVLGEGDIVARFGGDEFALCLPDAGDHDLSDVVDRIGDALEAPITLGETTVAIAGSIGIAIAPDHGSDSDTLLRRADLAMYEAKRRHQRAATFRAEYEGSDPHRLALLGDLRQALSDGSIEVHFQPQLDLRDGSVHSVEALARWHHHAHGDIPPDVFIPLAEQAGLIGRLTLRVLDLALAGVRGWLDDGRSMSVAVNVSAQSLVNESLPRVIAAALRRLDVPAHLLTLEITEGAMIGDSLRTGEVLDQLAALGVRVSVDDFGTGYSSMVNLRHLPISELKIDRSFVSEMLAGANDRVIVSSAIDLGHNLGMSVVAEGVESSEVADELGTLGCDLAQGFAVCRPMPLDRVTRYLESTAPGPPDTAPPLPEDAGADRSSVMTRTAG